jgi:hypothetical protein
MHAFLGWKTPTAKVTQQATSLFLVVRKGKLCGSSFLLVVPAFSGIFPPFLLPHTCIIKRDFLFAGKPKQPTVPRKMESDTMYVRASTNFKSKNKGDLSFKKNQIIVIKGKIDDKQLYFGEYVGKKGLKTGYFPFNTVRLLSEKELNEVVSKHLSFSHTHSLVSLFLPLRFALSFGLFSPLTKKCPPQKQEKESLRKQQEKKEEKEKQKAQKKELKIKAKETKYKAEKKQLQEKIANRPSKDTLIQRGIWIEGDKNKLSSTFHTLCLMQYHFVCFSLLFCSQWKQRPKRKGKRWRTCFRIAPEKSKLAPS